MQCVNVAADILASVAIEVSRGLMYNIITLINQENIMDNKLITKEKQSETDLNGYIRQFLENMGFCTRLKGFDYLARVIELVYTEPSRINGIVKNVYEPIALEYCANLPCVERNCRTLLRDRWTRCDALGSDICTFPRLHNGKSVPAIKEFVYITCSTIATQLAEKKENRT